MFHKELSLQRKDGKWKSYIHCSQKVYKELIILKNTFDKMTKCISFTYLL